MRIYSQDDCLIATFPETGVIHRWNWGTHTVNVYDNGYCIDAYTFAWHKNRASMLDFTTALQSYLSEE